VRGGTAATPGNPAKIVWGTGGPEFKSRRSDHKTPWKQGLFAIIILPARIGNRNETATKYRIRRRESRNTPEVVHSLFAVGAALS
jgi:hypothetical protein